MASKAVPTLCFKFRGKNYSVVSVDEEAGVIHASRIHYGRRLAGHPTAVPIGAIRDTFVRNIRRKGK